ncbi:hypothetical protein [Streptomyces purpureus]|uniref:SseB protein N-terminal domain-containing protein n=1 Tax=Streptomyces purpureus TaxID=1951 RepID=A0A918HJI5_9ACTN|nr:hypothetical protein [Streptomyces purpureus]GGT65909.1 hypothetical protein GCM10014713_68380 [Streptomyces purpureus]
MNFDELWGEVRGASTERVLKGAVDAPRGGAPAADDRGAASAEAEMDESAIAAARESVLERLADFRSRAVLVPMDSAGGLWTADLGGIAWICAFTDEEKLARFAVARGEESGEWAYRRVLGSRLLDEVVPALAFPCGVALDAGGPGGTVFPPVQGIVPDRAAVDVDVHGGGRA